MNTAALAFTPRIRLRLVSDDPEALSDLLEKVYHEECTKDEPVDYILSDEGAADMFQRVRSECKKRVPCDYDDHDEYDWSVGFHSQEARRSFIGFCRWIGAGITEEGIAIPASTATEMAALLR